ncbi:hypothetical protein H0H81_006297 [Sphagnurus paluster]|uniref:Uncharacterized protein n=1 Tax=Sphagnurus paluster TaxID=117069 RepID=A0A9P7FTU5_9AGAR|nr:hypothetical protein H0H81_006297 [Sphagnurus paluster]
MAPVATPQQSAPAEVGLKASEGKVFNPFYSPSIGDDGDNTYQYSQFKPSFPNLLWEPLVELEVTERGLSADPSKKSLFDAAQKVNHLTPAIGTEIVGLDLRQLSESQKDEL